jgi:hypothetical protein
MIDPRTDSRNAQGRATHPGPSLETDIDTHPESPDAPYRQCFLRRGAGDRRTTWLPEALARVGRVLSLRDGHAWSDGWTVAEAYETIRPLRELLHKPDLRAEGRGQVRWHRDDPNW